MVRQLPQRKKADRIERPSRWGAWERDVLSKVDRPAECQRLIQRRQAEVDDDRNEADEVAWQFRDQLRRRGHDPDMDCFFILSGIAAEWLSNVSGKRWATNKATSHLKTLAIPELTVSKKDGRPGWCWRGKGAARGATMKRLRDLRIEDEVESNNGLNKRRPGQVEHPRGR